MYKPEKEQIVKDAQNNGYKWNSDGSKLVNGNKTITFSETGNSVKVNGSGPYNNPSDVKNSSGY